MSSDERRSASVEAAASRPRVIRRAVLAGEVVGIGIYDELDAAVNAGLQLTCIQRPRVSSAACSNSSTLELRCKLSA